MSFESRELRILQALEPLEDSRPPGGDIDVHDLVTATGLDKDEVIRGVMALSEGGFVATSRPLTGDNRIETIHGIGLLPAGRSAIGQWPSRGFIERKQAGRFVFMRHLYTITQGNRLVYRAANDLGADLGWTPEETDLVTDYLQNEGLIEFVGGGDGGQVSITHYGIQEVEESLTRPEQRTEHFPASITIIQDVHSSQVQVGTVGSIQSQQQISEQDKRAIEEFIGRFQSDLPFLDLSKHQEAEASADIATIRAQLAAPEPKRGILREALTPLRTLAEGVAGNAAFAALVELSKHLPF